jgi:hypothetical protein
MTPAKELDDVLLSRDLPLELRRAWTVHRSEDSRPNLMLTGVVDYKERDEVISPYLLRQNLVVPAYPFRATGSALPPTC